MPRRVLVIGWDAADWKVAQPLLARGEMPHLQRLIQEGVHGNLATLQPILSPMLWTSIATGKRPPKHGILGFSEPTPDGQGVRPITILGRQTKAVWNILNQTGRRSVVVGWWPSHPAEPLNGVTVSDLFLHAGTDPDRVLPPIPGGVHPAAWGERLAELRVHPTELDGAMLRLFVPKFDQVDQEHDKALHSLAQIVAETMSVHAIATEVLEHTAWDFAAVYYAGIDHFSHRFMAYHPPRLPWVTSRDFELYGEVVANAYRYHDAMLGRLRALAGPETTVILLSDHGFHPDRHRRQRLPAEPAGPAAEHRPLGMFVMAGPGLRRGQTLYGGNLLDLTPTVLQLFNLPVGEDMDGKVMVTAWETPPDLQRIPSWDEVAGEDGGHPRESQVDGVVAAEAMKQLIALGYVAPPGEDLARTLDETLLELQYNLARAHADALRPDLAEQVLEPLRARWPEDHRLVQTLFEACLEQGKLDRCKQLLDDFDARMTAAAPAAEVELKRRLAQREAATKAEADLAAGDRLADPAERRDQFELRQLAEKAGGYEVLRQVLRLRLALALADAPRARQILAQLGEIADPDATLARLLALSHFQLEDLTTARRFARRALAADPEDAHAHGLSARIEFAAGKYTAAAKAAVESLSLLHFQPLLHVLLGQALTRLRRYDEARRAFEIAAGQLPGLIPAHEGLAWLCEHVFRQTPEAAHHRACIDALRRRQTTPSPTPSPLPPHSVPLAQTAGADAPVSLAPSATRAGRPPRLPPSLEGPATWTGVEAADLITVVSGLPRTGTSMMMQILAAGGCPILTDGQREADPDNPRGYLEYAAAARLQEDRSWVPQARGRAVKVVAQLLPHLPPEFHYRVIFMHRDLREVLASQQAMLQRQGRTGGNLAPDQLARVLERQVTRITHWLQKEPHFRVLHLDYSAVLTDPAAAVSQLATFLGPGLDLTAMQAAVHPELHRQRAASNPA